MHCAIITAIHEWSGLISDQDDNASMQRCCGSPDEIHWLEFAAKGYYHGSHN